MKFKNTYIYIHYKSFHMECQGCFPWRKNTLSQYMKINENERRVKMKEG